MSNDEKVIRMKTCYQGVERRSTERNENDELNTYLREISSYPQLSIEEEKDFAKKLKTVTTAQNKNSSEQI